MKPLEKVYWLRLGLGVVAALICTAYAFAAGLVPHNPPLDFPTDYRVFFNSLSIALVTYLVSYYAIKAKFLSQVEKPQKLMTTGIGIYFLGWIVVWVLLYTIIAGPPTI
jgi:hypothetical protein